MIEVRNTAKLVKRGEDYAADIHIETTIKDEKRLQLLLSRSLTSAGRAEFEVQCMSDIEVELHLRNLEETNSLTIT